MRPSELGLRTTDLHALDRQSQASRRGCRIREVQNQPFIFADDFVLLASSQQSSHALDGFSVACDRAEI